ncbi:MAG: PAS domain S-box protein [Desulfamplus sp.]|nr:PAS domain S-box protein [Desulfamplus sp.]
MLLKILDSDVVGLSVAIIFILISSLMFIWNRRLKREIKEHRATEEALEIERANMRSLMDAAPVAIIIIDSNYCITKANKKAEHIFSKNDDNIKDRPCGDLIACIHIKDHPKGCGYSAKCPKCPMRNAIIRVISKREPTEGQEMEATIYDDDGSTISKRWLRFSIEPLSLIDNPNCAVAALDDVTDSKIIEQSLRAEEARIRAITESAQDAILMMDPIGNISFWNRAAESILGYKKDEAMGKNLHYLIAPARYIPLHQEAFKFFRETGQGTALGKIVAVEAKRKDGVEISIELSLSSINLADGWYAVGIIRDTTERKLAEAEIIKAKEEAESATRAKSEFLANMSHEIRTPMNVIIGMSRLIKDTALNSEQIQYVDMLSHSSEILLSLIEDILDFSKIEAGKVELESIEFDLSELVSKIVDILRIKASEKALGLNCNIDNAVPRFLKGDPNRLRQIILNLINNAVKFTNTGEITITIKPLIQRVVDKPQNKDGSDIDKDGYITILFEIKDSGIGIPQDRLDKLFQPFSQADTSTTRKFGGTGLGLVISKRLVELMSGDIWVESEYEKGTIFRFTAQFDEAEGSNSHICELNSSEIISDKEIASLRVLIAEDNAFNQILALKVLEKMGICADVASNGIEAVNSVVTNNYDVVLMDIQMPEMDGIEATKLIRDKGFDIPIIAMTANVTTEDREKCIASGMNGYLSKPFDPDKLLSLLIKYL